MSVLEIVRMIGSEFSEVSDDEVEAWQELVAPAISNRVFKTEYNHALALLICHSLKMAGKGEQSFGSISDTGRLASISEGGTSVSFASNNSATDADAEYRLTSYGMQFLTLRKRKVIPIIIR